MLRFIFVLHNHQPIGNFTHVFEQSYQDSYLPFLDVYEGFGHLKLTLHTSGSLFEWLLSAHPEYVQRLANLVQQGRIEIVGGPFYEPILAMIPSRDRIGQIKLYSDWLNANLGAKINGMWVPERVWEQSYVPDLVDAGMQYTILDDAHFKNAGLERDALSAHYVTEDNGKTMFVFPGSEKLRYLIPFRPLDELLQYLSEYAKQYPDGILLHADDGEKFGSWPNTHKHVFKDGWLERFFQALSDNRHWLMTTTPSEALATVAPIGKIYIPDGSYREMTEWALPAAQQQSFSSIYKDAERDERWERIKPFLKGGYWRNFKVRYPETDEMYCRMLGVSNRLDEIAGSAGILPASGDAGILPAMQARSLRSQATESLYRGQCNCSYWHGAFGGVYLPHLRNAVYNELIAADNALDTLSRPHEDWVDAQIGDFNFDAKNEVRLESDRFCCFLAPQKGGVLYELDIKPICHNLLATLTRKQEAYHQKVLSQQNGQDNIVFKQDGLDKRLQYDSYPRKSLIDLFYGTDVTFDAVKNASAQQYGTFLNASFQSEIQKKQGKIRLIMTALGSIYGAEIRLSKGITLTAGSDTIEIAYKLEGIPLDFQVHFAMELNIAGLPSGASDRYYTDENGKKLGHLGTPLDLRSVQQLSLTDEWLGLTAELNWQAPTNVYAFPIEAVSQSEGGFELVHQSVALQPHWLIVPDENGNWNMEMSLRLKTS